MSKKQDIRQIERIAKDYRMSPEERREFGDFIEDCKRNGERGCGKNGDFTFAELKNKVREFRGETS